MSTQVAKASTWGFAGRTVLLLANFATTPFTIRLLGPSAYGLWALVPAVFLWASLAEGGMWAATTKYGAERYANGDAPGEAVVIWSGLGFALTTTSAVALALGLGAHFLLGLLHVSRGLLGAGTWALRVSCAAFVVGAATGAIDTAQQVRLRWKQFTLVNTVSNLVGTVGVPLAIYLLSGGLVAAAAVSLVASSLNLFGLSWAGARVQPALLRPHFDRATLRKLLRYGGALTVANFAGIPLATGERFFLGANTSTTAVAYYAVAATVATTLLVLPEQLTSPLIPALARLQSEGRAHEHRALYGKSLSGLFLVATPAAVLVAFVAKPFLTLWAGPSYGAHSTTPLLIVLGGVWANALAWVAGSYLLSAAKTKLLAWLELAEVAPYLVAAWMLTAKWGVLGAAAVWSARLAIDAAAHLIMVHRVAGLPWLPLSERRLRSVAAPLLLGVTCLVATELSSGLIARAATAAVLLAGYCASVWWLVLTSRERRGVARLVSEILA